MEIVNKDQVVIILRRVNKELSVHEDFIGVYAVETTGSATWIKSSIEKSMWPITMNVNHSGLESIFRGRTLFDCCK